MSTIKTKINNSQIEGIAHWDLRSILDRVKEREKLRKDSDLADVFHVPKTRIEQWKARGTIPWDLLTEYAIKRGASLDWLIIGRGEPAGRSDYVAEPSAQYAAGKVIDEALLTDVIRAVDDELAEAESSPDEEKQALIIATVYRQADTANGFIDRQTIKTMIALAI